MSVAVPTAANAFRIVYECRFDRAADVTPDFLSGWSNPEADFTWTEGHRAELSIPAPAAPAGCTLLELSATPFGPRQAFTVRIDDVAIAHHALTEPATVAFRVDLRVPAGQGTCRLRFDLPDAARPCDISDSPDTRRLALAFTRLRLIDADTPPPLIQWPEGGFLGAFENIGDNCEFATLQRHAGIEQISLLRFADHPFAQLVRAFDERFAAFDDPAAIVPEEELAEQQWNITIPAYGMGYHTFIKLSRMDRAAVHQQQSAHLLFLRRKLFEDIAEGQKILVYKRNAWLDEPEILALYAAVNRIGRVNLLCARPADERHPEGTVEILAPGLFVGYLGAFGDCTSALPVSPQGWRAICEAAATLAAA